MPVRPAAAPAAPAASLAPLLLLLAAALSGCVDDGSRAADLDALEALDVYWFVYPGAEKAVPGAAHGLLFRIHNPWGEGVSLHVGAAGVGSARLGPATDEGWRDAPEPPSGVPGLPDAAWGGRVELAAGGSVAYLASVASYHDGPVRLLLVTSGGAVREVPVPVGRDDAGPPVLPGDHIRTVTVGVWVNGTSFYTNSRSLLDDPHFPADGMDVGAARQETEPLPVYVYGDDRSEQPAASRDTCHFTTIDGYNDLLKSQVTGGTGVRWLAPGEAYTRPGAEDHFLYGDALVFLNTVVAHDGATEPADAVPDPTGACFDAQGHLPPVPPTPLVPLMPQAPSLG